MDSKPTDHLIESLDLTRREERELRSIAGLPPPEPKGRLDRFLYAPLKGARVWMALLAVTIFWVTLFYAAWKLSDVSKEFNEFLKVMAVPIWIFAFLLVQRRRDRLVVKLYRALEKDQERVKGCG